MSRREQSLRMTFEARVDWWRVVMDLRRLGWGTPRLMRCIGTPRTTIIGWMQGAEPKHADGERLVQLWAHATGHTRDDLPML